ncbi:MAG: sugar ABC transporter permease [Halanaerobiales bacterium]|nr:sugar ABC transporter permease [Halanaerobiales bacterium]
MDREVFNLFKLFKEIWRERSSYFFISPALIIFVVFFIYPIFYLTWLSFTDSRLIGPPAALIGLENFQRLLTDQRFIISLKNTVVLTVLTTIGAAVISLFLAYLLSKKLRFSNLYKTLLYIPVITPVVASSRIWEYVLESTPRGLFNYILSFLQLPPQAWLDSPRLAIYSVAIMMIWQGVGWDMIIFLVGLRGIPDVFYEVALLDGANAGQRFRHITLPLLKPVITFVIIIGTINGFKIFDQVLLLTNGGPIYATRTIVLDIYRNIFNSFETGYAAAESVFLAVIIILITVVQRKFLTRGELVSYE